jgi:hypothetical protein
VINRYPERPFRQAATRALQNADQAANSGSVRRPHVRLRFTLQVQSIQATHRRTLIAGGSAMAYQALATGPVSFLDPNSSQQQIPLSTIYFDSDGPHTTWPKYQPSSADTKKLVDDLLATLYAQGLLVPGTQTAPTPSLTITAAQAGTTGNVIQVNISNVAAAANTMTVAVSATEVYPGLTTDTIAAALGTSASAANGLIYLQSNNNQPPGAFAGKISAAPDLNCAVPEAADSTKTAFVVAATDSADPTDAINIAVNVAPDPSPAATFTLTASWMKSQDNVTLAMLTTAATNPFSLLVNFSGPADGPLPAPGIITLQGGSNAASSPAVPASVNVLSS